MMLAQRRQNQEVNPADSALPQVTRDNLLARIEAGRRSISPAARRSARVHQAGTPVGKQKKDRLAVADVQRRHFKPSLGKVCFRRRGGNQKRKQRRHARTDRKPIPAANQHSRRHPREGKSHRDPQRRRGHPVRQPGGKPQLGQSGQQGEKSGQDRHHGFCGSGPKDFQHRTGKPQRQNGGHQGNRHGSGTRRTFTVPWPINASSPRSPEMTSKW